MLQPLPLLPEHLCFKRVTAGATDSSHGDQALRPETEVWVATGDGDAHFDRGNNTIHMLRRNVGIKVLLFNNKITD